jgi:hypothetical protein
MRKSIKIILLFVCIAAMILAAGCVGSSAAPANLPTGIVTVCNQPVGYGTVFVQGTIPQTNADIWVSVVDSNLNSHIRKLGAAATAPGINKISTSVDIGYGNYVANGNKGCFIDAVQL